MLTCGHLRRTRFSGRVPLPILACLFNTPRDILGVASNTAQVRRRERAAESKPKQKQTRRARALAIPHDRTAFRIEFEQALKVPRFVAKAGGKNHQVRLHDAAVNQRHAVAFVTSYAGYASIIFRSRARLTFSPVIGSCSRPARQPSRRAGQLLWQPNEVVNVHAKNPVWKGAEARTHGEPRQVVRLSDFQPALEHLGRRRPTTHHQQLARLRQIARAGIQTVEPLKRNLLGIKAPGQLRVTDDPAGVDNVTGNDFFPRAVVDLISDAKVFPAPFN